jgi:hypothetical protein
MTGTWTFGLRPDHPIAGWKTPEGRQKSTTLFVVTVAQKRGVVEAWQLDL